MNESIQEILGMIPTNKVTNLQIIPDLSNVEQNGNFIDLSHMHRS